jgi:anti-sigma regulatory factor (Ser/Thr protein kinase)
LAKRQRSHLTIDSELSNLSLVADFIARAARESGLDERATYHVQMAVDEATTNVMEHAYHGKSDGRIDIFCQQQGDEFVVEIRDFGKPFDPSKVRTPRVKGPLSRRTIGGLGIFFMRKLMDRVEFSTGAERGNRLRLVKRIR